MQRIPMSAPAACKRWICKHCQAVHQYAAEKCQRCGRELAGKPAPQSESR